MKINRKLLEPAVLSEVEFYQHREDYDGYCFSCKEWTDGGVEPDGCEDKCPNPDCGQLTVFGAEELAIMDLLELT